MHFYKTKNILGVFLLNIIRVNIILLTQLLTFSSTTIAVKASVNNITVNSTIVKFPDKNLENAIREKINGKEGDIYRKDLKDIRQLKINHAGISNLEGIQYIANLNSLDLRFNNIEDIKPLSVLRNLSELELGYNKIKDLTPLSRLKNLKVLDLSSNGIKDVSALQGLRSLEKLNLDFNRIKDIEALGKLKNLEQLSS
jgi:internalin A